MPAQRLMTQAEYITYTDGLAKAAEYMLEGAGDEDTVGTAAYEARLVRDMIIALDEPNEYQITVDLAEPLGSVVTALLAEGTLRNYFGVFNSAVMHHLNGTELGAWLTDGAVRVHSLVKRCVNTQIPAVNVFPPVTELGSVAVTDAAEGTFTAGDAVDATKYGGAQIELEVTDGTIGAVSIVATVAVTLANGTTTTKTGTITNGSVAGTKVALGSSTDRIVAATGVTFTGGTAADAFKIQTKEDRTL